MSDTRRQGAMTTNRDDVGNPIMYVMAEVGLYLCIGLIVYVWSIF